MRRPQGPIGGDKSEVIAELPAACSDERTAVEFMERQRWGDAPKCPRCDSSAVYQMRDRKTGERSSRYLWRCHGCKRQYTVRVGMICEDSKIPLRFWCYAFWRICSSKKGVSSLQIKRETGLTYRSAYFLMSRVRWAMREDHATPPKLGGVVEVDETYVGGKPRYKRHGDGRGYKKGAMSKKGQVVALLERGGSVRALVHKKTKGYTFKDIIRQRVDPSSIIYSDEAQRYVGLGREFAGHEAVRHRAGEYVRGPVSSNSVEGFFSLLKRGVIGTFHSLSVRRLPLYVSEFEFRHNTRHFEDGARTIAAIQSAEGKRLTVKDMAGI